MKQFEQPTEGQIIRWIQSALERHPESVKVRRLRELVLEVRSGTRRHPARAEIAITDGLRAALKGNPWRNSEVIILTIPREVRDTTPGDAD